MKRMLGALAAAALFVLAVPAALAQDHPSLFSARTVPNASPLAQVHARGLMRQRDVAPDLSLIDRVRASLSQSPAVPVEIEIPVFDDTPLVVSLNRVEAMSHGAVSLTGTVNGVAFSTATLVLSQGLLAGTLHVGNRAYQILGVGHGRYQVTEIDRTQLQDEGDNVEPPQPFIPKALSQPDVPAALADDGSTIDLLVVYTPQARASASPGDTSNPAPILSQIDLAVAAANLAYSNSGVVQRLRLVHAEEVVYNDSGSMSTDLNKLTFSLNATNDPAGQMDNVQTLRDAYGADAVTLMVQAGGPTEGGLGWIQDPVSSGFAPYAYNVVRLDQASSNQTLAHELGHNMGLRHDAAVDANTTSPYPWAHGYVDTAHAFRTVMAYDNACTSAGISCTRIDGFSSPLHTFNGAATGKAATADAARVLNDTRTTVANFRAAVSSGGLVQVRNATVNTNEGAGTVLVPVARLGGTSGAASVDWATGTGTAIDGTDYTSASGTLNWADGDGADKNISVAILQDSVADGPKTFPVTISNVTGADLSASVTSNVVIADDEPDAFPVGCTMPSGFTTPTGANAGWGVTTASASEGSCSLKSNTLNAPPSTEPGCITPPVTYHKAQTQFVGTFLPGNITFDARTSSEGGYDCLHVFVDGTEQNIGTCAGYGHPGFSAAINNVDSGWQPFSVPVSAGTHTLKFSYENDCYTAGDNAAYVDKLVMPLDPATIPKLSFAQPTYSVTEGGAMVSVQVTRSGATTGAISVTWATSNGAAVAGQDFGTSGNAAQKTGTLSWAAGDSSVKTITVGGTASLVPIINDAAFEGTEDFTITLSAPTGGAQLGAQPTTTVSIVDDESSFAFDAPALSVGEAGPNVTLNVTRTGSLATTATVHYMTANGTAIAAVDYTTTSGTLTFAPGESVKAITIGSVAAAAPHVPVINDTAIEGPKTFTIALSLPTGGGQLGSPVTSTLTIVSDDKGIAMGAATRSVPENAGAIDIQVLRLGSATGAIGAHYAFTNGTAINGTHYAGVAGDLAWADGDSAAKTIHVPITDDSVVNANRTFTVMLSAATGASLGAPASTMVTIADDDNTVQFNAATATVTEGGTLTLSVTRLGGTAAPASVQWSTGNGTAVAGTDFGTLGVAVPVSGTLNWGAADAAPKSIVVPIINDTIVQGARTFTVGLSSPGGAAIGTISVVNVTLNDNDSGFAFASSTYDVNENGGNVTLSVKRIGPATAAASVKWASANGAALAGSDFGTLGSAVQRSGMLTWTAGDATAKTIVIPILNDAIAEPDETFTVSLNTPSAGTILGTPATATVTIHDDDIPPESELGFSLPKYLVLESAGSVMLTVNRTDIGGGFGRSATVNYATTPGTAMATSDYTTTTGTLIWAGGDSAPKNIFVPIKNDSIPEPPEAFKVTLSAVTPGARISTTAGAATVVIADDDEVFPHAGAFPANWVVPGTATAGWAVSNDPGAYEGVLSLRSEGIADNETAQVELTGTFVAGTVSFRVRVSSELDFDVMAFYVDGVKLAQWSGTTNTAWQLYSTPLPAGLHTLRWSYEKDGSASVGQDAAWIDAVTMPAYTP